MRALIVEDDLELADLVRRALRKASWAPDVVSTGADAIRAMTIEDYDLVVLDLGLPDIDGIEVCREVRARGVRTPILVLTARDALLDRVIGLDVGADDYLTKPFAIEELLARLRAIVRRPPTLLDVKLRVADVEFDVASRRATRAGRAIVLTARESALLEYMLRNEGRILSRGTIITHVWDDNFDPVGNAVDVLVARVRRKVDPEGLEPLIHTVRGIGYVLAESWRETR